MHKIKIMTAPHKARLRALCGAVIDREVDLNHFYAVETEMNVSLF